MPLVYSAAPSGDRWAPMAKSGGLPVGVGLGADGVLGDLVRVTRRGRVAAVEGVVALGRVGVAVVLPGLHPGEVVGVGLDVADGDRHVAGPGRCHAAGRGLVDRRVQPAVGVPQQGERVARAVGVDLDRGVGRLGVVADGAVRAGGLGEADRVGVDVERGAAREDRRVVHVGHQDRGSSAAPHRGLPSTGRARRRTTCWRPGRCRACRPGRTPGRWSCGRASSAAGRR